MPKERTLLERLNNPSSVELLATTVNKTVLAESVLQHLTKMLNTRRGHSLTQPDDYGMPDLTELVHDFPESINEVKEAIRSTIEKYERRLEKVKVDHIASDDELLTLRFKITAQIMTDRERTPVEFETLVEPSGQVELKG